MLGWPSKHYHLIQFDHQAKFGCSAWYCEGACGALGSRPLRLVRAWPLRITPDPHRFYCAKLGRSISNRTGVGKGSNNRWRYMHSFCTRPQRLLTVLVKRMDRSDISISRDKHNFGFISAKSSWINMQTYDRSSFWGTSHFCSSSGGPRSGTASFRDLPTRNDLWSRSWTRRRTWRLTSRSQCSLSQPNNNHSVCMYAAKLTILWTSELDINDGRVGVNFYYPRDVVSGVFATAKWLAGWLAGWLCVRANIVSKRLNLA